MMIKNQSLTAVSKSFSLLKKNNEKIFSRDIFWRIGCIFLWGGVVGWIVNLDFQSYHCGLKK